jgi:hypothetical protein
MELLGLAGLAVGGLVGLVILEATIRRSDVGGAMVLGTLLLTTIFTEGQFDVFVGSIRIGLNDLLFVVLVTAAIARLLRSRRLTVTQRLLVAYSALVLWAITRGIMQFGPTHAVNSGRGFLVFIAATLYFSTVEPTGKLIDRLGALWVGASLALAGLSMLRWAANAAGLVGGVFGTGGSLRVVSAPVALIIAQGALISLPYVTDRTRPILRLVAPTLLVFVVLLQHRSVWVVTAAGVILLLYRERSLGPRVLVALGAALCVFALLLTFVFDGQTDAVTEDLATSAQDSRTFEWRVQGWLAMLDPNGPGPTTIEEWSVGQPIGVSSARMLPDGRVVDVSPHNFYIEVLVRVGIIGLIILLAIYAKVLPGLARVHREGSLDASLLTANVLFVVVAVQLVYYIPYSGNNAAQALLLGLGCAVASAGLRAIAPVPVPVEARR